MFGTPFFGRNVINSISLTLKTNAGHINFLMHCLCCSVLVFFTLLNVFRQTFFIPIMRSIVTEIACSLVQVERKTSQMLQLPLDMKCRLSAPKAKAGTTEPVN